MFFFSCYSKDLFAMKTPGGGGYGKPCDDEIFNEKLAETSLKFSERGSVYDYRQAQESV